MLTLLFFVGSGIYITLYFLSGNIVFFITPSELSVKHLNKKVRVGGLVQVGSINKPQPDLTIFAIHDNRKSIKVEYKGVLPALFRESQGIVAEGVFSDLSGIFYATRLLTKHDENYKPPHLSKPSAGVLSEKY